MADDQRTEAIRVANDEETNLRLGVIRISNRDAERVRKDCCRLYKLDAMPFEILVGLLRIEIAFAISGIARG